MTEPVDVVRNVVGAIQTLDVEEGSAYFCEALAPEMEGALEAGFDELAAMGLNPDEVRQAFTIELQELEIQEKSRGDDEATIHVTGTLRLDFDADVLKEVLRKVFEASGQDITDQELDFLVNLFGFVADRGTPLDAEIKLVKEGGQWLVCDELSFLQDLFQLPLP